MILFALQNLLFAQIYQQKSDISRSIDNISEGFLSSISVVDIPIGLAYVGRNLINPSTIGDRIIFGPSNHEMEFSEDFGSSKSYSLGSMDKDIIPNFIFYGRLASTFLFDSFTNSNIDSKSYQNIFLFKKSLIYTYVATEVVKNLIKRERPDGSDNRSFFSGHTSTTFAASTFLALEFNTFYNNWDLTEKNKPLRVVFKVVTFSTLYGWAGYVGYSRLKDKKHFLSDVLVGAAAGSLISYIVYQHYNDSVFNNLNVSTRNGKDVYLSFGVGL